MSGFGGEEGVAAEVEFGVMISVGAGPVVFTFVQRGHNLLDVIAGIEGEGIFACESGHH